MPATWDNVLDSFEYVRINSAEYFTMRPTKHTYSPSHNNEGSAGEFPKQNVTNARTLIPFYWPWCILFFSFTIQV